MVNGERMVEMEEEGEEEEEEEGEKGEGDPDGQERSSRMRVGMRETSMVSMETVVMREKME